MSQVETVALWVGLISSISGIALSIVAIVFSLLVNRRSDTVTQHTVQSLQKIESTVERVSADTSELIKVAWERMLGTMSIPPTGTSDERKLVSGLTAELREELRPDAEANPQESADSTERIERLEEMTKGLADALSAQRLARSSRASVVDRLVVILNTLSDGARALTSEIRRHHVTRSQYLRLVKGDRVRDAVRELRSNGLLVPLEGLSEVGKEIPVYFFPPGLTEEVRAAVLLMAPPLDEARVAVRDALRKAEYPLENEHA